MGPVPESALSPCFTLFATWLFFSLQQIWLANSSFLLWRGNTHTYIDTHTKKEGSQWGLEGLWVGKQRIALLSVQMWLNFSLYARTTEEELLNMIFVLFFHPLIFIRIFILKKDDGDFPVCNGFYVLDLIFTRFSAWAENNACGSGNV